MTQHFKPGELVYVSDYAVRVVDLTASQVLDIAERHGHIPAPVLRHARSEGGRKRRRYSIWAPASADPSQQSRNYPGPGSLGVIVRKLNLEDHATKTNGDETDKTLVTRAGYHVAYRLDTPAIAVPAANITRSTT